MSLSEEELRKMVENGAKVYKWGRSGFSVFVPWEGRFIRIPKELKSVAEELYMKQKGSEQKVEQAGDRSQLRRATGDVLRELSKQYAELVSELGDRVSWFAQALMDIGFAAMLAAFTYAKVPPEEFARKVMEFNDPDGFTRFVLNHFDALLKAGLEGGRAIAEVGEKLDQVEDELEQWKLYARLAESVSYRLAQERDEYKNQLKLLLTMACDDCRRRMLLATALARVGG